MRIAAALLAATLLAAAEAQRCRGIFCIFRGGGNRGRGRPQQSSGFSSGGGGGGGRPFRGGGGCAPPGDNQVDIIFLLR